MAEAETRPCKTPLRKQPEIEEVEEEQAQSEGVLLVKKTNDISLGNGEDLEDDSNLDEFHMSVPTNGEAERLVMDGKKVSMEDNNIGCPETQSIVQTEASTTESSSCSPSTLKMNHSFSKTKHLVRGTAIDDGAPAPVLPEVKVITTPAPDNDDDDGPYEYNPPAQIPLLGQDTSSSRSVLQKNGSLSSDAGTSNCSLSRESSIEKNLYRDNSGVDVEEFIKRTLVKSKKDRQMLLSLERDFKIFVESGDQHYQLSEMSSYDRMICHRVAAFYGMDHNIDKSGKCVIVSKTKITRIPTFCCEDHLKTIEPEESTAERRQMRVLKKPASMEERSRGGDKAQFSSHRTKSLEERQKRYDEKRKMIFGNSASEEAQSYSVIEPVPAANLCKRLNSREWSSTDSSGYMSEDGSRQRRSMMAKSNSDGGKPTIHLTPNTRTCSLSKAELSSADNNVSTVDSITSGNYESGSIHTKIASPENSQSPNSGRSSVEVNSTVHGNAGCGTGPPYTVLIATDINTIPPGSMVVNPHTLLPHTNSDGTPYRYDPSDPTSVPPWLGSGASTHPSQQHPTATHISFNPTPVQPVQYTQNNDLCNRFSAMEVATSMETSLEGQQMVALSAQPPHQHHPHPVAQPHLQQQQQQPSQPGVMMSTGMQPSQQFVSYGGAPQGPGYYTGAQLQFVPVEAQPPCMSMTGPSGGSVPSGMVSYGQPHIIQPASAMQPTMLDQSSMTPGLYGQNIYTGPVTDSSGNPNGYCVPYVSNSVVYPSSHYPANGVSAMAMAPTGSTHYNPYGAPQQSQSPQLTSFTQMQGAPVRPATPPSLPIGQPVGYHSQQAPGMAMGHSMASAPQFQHGTYYAPQPHPFPAQTQVMHMSVRPQGGAGSAIPASNTHPHPQPLQGHHQQAHPNPPTLQHSQSFPVLRTVPSAGATPLALGPAPNPAPIQPQHPMMSMKSMSMGSIRPGGGSATPDKDNSGMSMGGATAFLPSFNQAAAVPVPGQFVAQSIRQPQHDLRVMGTASIRPQIAQSLIAIQPGQTIRSSRPSGPRQTRPPKRNHSSAGSNNPPTTTASASVARVMSVDSGATHHQLGGRQ